MKHSETASSGGDLYLSSVRRLWAVNGRQGVGDKAVWGRAIISQQIGINENEKDRKQGGGAVEQGEL